MKFVIFTALLFILASTNAAAVGSDEKGDGPVNVPPTTNIAVAIKDFYNALRKMMPCGFAKYNIPPLAPFSQEYLAVNYSNEYLKISGSLSDITVTGLNDFRFLKMNFDEKSNRTSFDFILNNLQVLGEYELDFWANLAGFPVTIDGKGLLDYKVVDFRLFGEFVLGQNDKNVTDLKISELKMNFSVGDVIANNWNTYWDIALNNYMNRFAHQHLKMLAQQLQGQFNKMLQEYYVPYVNEQLSTISIDELINIYVVTAQEFNSFDCKPEA